MVGESLGVLQAEILYNTVVAPALAAHVYYIVGEQPLEFGAYNNSPAKPSQPNHSSQSIQPSQPI